MAETTAPRSAALEGPGIDRPALVWSALAVVYLLWGSTYFGIRIAVETIPPLLMAGVRFLIAGAVLLAWRLPPALRAGKRPTAVQWRSAATIGALLLLGGNGLVSWAEQTVPSGVTALIVSVAPLWMAIIDRVTGGPRVSRAAIAGLVLGFAGVAVLAAPTAGGAASKVGELTLVVASFLWAAGSIYSRDARMPDDSLLGTGMQMVAGGAMLSIAGASTGELAHLHVAAISTASWAAFAYLVVFGAVIGFGAYLWLIRNAPIGLVSTYAYVNPLVAVLLGSAVLHERLDARIAIAGAIIVCGVALMVTSKIPRPAAARA